MAQGGGSGEMLKLHLHNVGIGHRMYCSYGNECDLSMPEILAYYGQDEGTRVIMLQTESFKDPRAFLEVLDNAPCREMLCVGHNPNLSGLLSVLVGAPRRPFAWLEKNGAARIDLGLDGRPPGRLIWLLAAGELRRLAAAEADDGDDAVADLDPEADDG